MLSLKLSGSGSAALAAKGYALREAGRALVRLHETDPDLTAAAGVEVASLEARGILEGGAVERVEKAIEGGSAPAINDVESLSRLEGILGVAESRLDAWVGSLEARDAGAPVDRLAGIIGLATGAVSLVKSIF